MPMALPNHNPNSRNASPSRLTEVRNAGDDAVPTDAELSRFLERQRAQKLGFELPLTTQEAGRYIGFHPKTVERMARMGEIPAHPVSGVRRKTWRLYPSELDAWLRSRVHSRRYPCSPNGRDDVD